MDEAGSIDASIATLARPDPGPTPGGAAAAKRSLAGAWLSIETDVSLGGEPAREWLVASPDGLFVCPTSVAAGESPPEAGTLRHVAWSELDRVRTAAGVGGGMLQVRVGGDWVDLVRYSNALAMRFHKLARALEVARESAAAAGTPVAEPAIDPARLDPPRCPSCSLRLVTADDACPRCLQKGRSWAGSRSSAWPPNSCRRSSCICMPA